VSTPTRKSTAVVIGAGIAGLTAARVLADRFDRVVVLDRDRLPDTATPRRGVPQGEHAHTLLVAGQNAFYRGFPGLQDELVAAGADLIEPGLDLRVHRSGEEWPKMSIGFKVLSLTRPLLELTLRRRAAALPGVEFRDEVAVQGLRGAAGRVTGAVLDGGEIVPADLVVDCSGRGGRSDRWLAALGFPAPEVVEVKIGIGYASRLLRRRPDDFPDCRGVVVFPVAPRQKLMGVALPVEGDRWLVGLGGWHGALPSGPGAFEECARALPHRAIADLIERAEPLTEVFRQQFPSSRRRLFERLRAVPAGYVASGDAVCSFNPIYGQGMTAAALQAEELGRALDRHGGPSADLARHFYRATAAVLATPWRFAVGADFNYPETTGPKPFGIDLVNRYSARLLRASRVSADVRRTFTAVQHLTAPPSALFAPATVVKVFRATSRRAQSPQGQPPQERAAPHRR